MIKTSALLTLLTFFTISFAYAHPNHITHEFVQHNTEQTSVRFINSNIMTYNTMEEKLGHSAIIPCTTQHTHKEVPCKKK